MSDYRVKVGHNENLIDLVVLEPQPACPGLEYTRATSAASGLVYREGPFLRFLYNVLPANEYDNVLNAFGLSNDETAAVTVYGLDELYGPQRYNGLAVRPVLGRDGARNRFFVRDVVILIRDLVAL